MLYPWVLRELANVIARPFSIIFEMLWWSEEIPEDWKKANVPLIFKKGKKEDPGSYRLVKLTLISMKMVEQIIMETIFRPMKKVMRIVGIIL